MRTRSFGGASVPIVGIGTWQMERDDRAQAIAAIRRALELGMTHVDTAEMYGDGRVEQMVGEAIAGQRDRVFLVSKVLPQHATYEGTRRACAASLKRLGTDHLDCYLLHWRGQHPLAETIRAFESLRGEGAIRTWGVSNFDDGDLDETLAIAGPGAIACNQVLYHLRERSIEQRVLPWCERNNVPVVAYSPFGSRNGFPRSPALEQLARETGATPRQLALAFLARRAFVIPKSARAAHVAELAGAERIELAAATVAAIDAAFPVGAWRGLPTL